jgi:hypothetical protein
VFGDRYILTRQRLYQFDPYEKKVHLRVVLPEGEVFATSPQEFGGHVVILGSRHLYFFDGRAFSQENGELTARIRLEVPGEVRNIGRIDLAELLDGYLVSFTFGKRSHQGEAHASQVLLRLDAQGRAQVLNRRELHADFPALFLHKSLVTSPLMSWLEQHAPVAVATVIPSASPGVPALRGIEVPAGVRSVVLLMSLLSMLISGWWLLQHPMSRRRKLVWLLAIGAMGLPGLLSLLLLHPRREHVELLHTVAA